MIKLSIKKNRLRILCLLFAILVAADPIGATTKVLAIPDLDYYSSNDILFYDPDASCGAPSTEGGVASLVGNTNAEKVWNFLRTQKGLTNEQTAGVMGNIQAESGFNPGIEEISGGGGYGIAQWTGGRRTALVEAAKRANGGQGVPVNDLAFQLEYLYQELNARETNNPRYRSFNNEWEMIKGQNTIEDALVAFHHEFEISHLMNGDPSGSPGGAADIAVIQARGQFAKDAFSSFAHTTPGGGGSAGGECEAAATGNLAQTTLAFAWPEYHPPDYTTKKGEYEAAVKRAQSEGRYVGGGPYPGVDCGGFVTLLMTQSGFEPGYNFNGRGGNTGPQEDWVEQNWKRVGTGSEIKVGGDPNDEKVLRQGDVAFQPGHTFVYVGIDIPGFGEGDPAFKGVASASYEIWRAPMVGHEDMTDGSLTWYRKK